MKWQNNNQKYKSISKKLFKSTSIMLILCSTLLYYIFGLLSPYSYTIFTNIYIDYFINNLQKNSTSYDTSNIQEEFTNITKNKISYSYIIFDEDENCLPVSDYEYVYTTYNNSSYILTKKQFDLAIKYANQELDSHEMGEYFMHESIPIPDAIRLSPKKEFNITLNDNKTYTVYLYYYDQSSFRSNFPYLFIVFPIMLIIILLFSFIISHFYSRKISNPIIKISNSAKIMANSNLKEKCLVESHDEIGTLGESLNELSANLSKTIEKLQVANSKLLEDVTNEKQMNIMKSNFFNAVSHEMKTPITILKGQLEGMLYNIGVYKDRDKYLYHSIEITESMENLLKELLTISRMESSNYNFNISKHNLSELINEALYNLNPIIKNKNQSIKKSINSNISIDIDVNLFKKVINNILLNAINYSPYSSIITIILKSDTLEITNSNCHIDEKELSKVFDAFYRIDKSRNKSLGGTGLGLYIVKTILDMHNFDYTLFNSENGVTFKIEFK